MQEEGDEVPIIVIPNLHVKSSRFYLVESSHRVVHVRSIWRLRRRFYFLHVYITKLLEKLYGEEILNSLHLRNQSTIGEEILDLKLKQETPKSYIGEKISDSKPSIV